MTTQLDIFGNETVVVERATPPVRPTAEQGRLFDDWAARGWTQLELPEDSRREGL